MIVSQFEEYKYIHELGSKPKLMLYWVRDSVALFKKGIGLLIKSNHLKVDEISRIDVIVDGGHGQVFLDFQ